MRKLLMLAVSAYVAVAFAGVLASSASADEPFTLYTAGYAEPCPEVSLVDGEVSGGCRVDGFEGDFDIYAYLPNPFFVGNYDSTFDLALDSDGDGYAVNPTVAPSGAYLGRHACDEADGTVLPWVVNAHAPNSFTFEVDVTVGVRPTGAGPGGACTQQTITLNVSEVGYSTLPGYGSPTELQQTAPSANLSNGYWSSDNGLYLEL